MMVSGVVEPISLLPNVVDVVPLLVVIVSTLGITIDLEDQVLPITQVEVMVFILLGEFNAKFVTVMATLPLIVLTA